MSPNRFRSCRSYDPATDTWAESTSLPVAVSSAAVTAVGRDIYVVGGYMDFGAAAIAYRGRVDGSSIVWTRMADYAASVHSAAAGGVNGDLDVIGGTDREGMPTDAVHRYDAAANRWIAVDPLPIAATAVAQAPDDGQALYYIGGKGIARAFLCTPGVSSTGNDAATATPGEESPSLSVSGANPASGRARISYTLSRSAEPMLRVHSVHGATTVAMACERREPGSYTVDLDISDLPAGVYIVSIFVDGSSASRLLIVE